MFKSWGWTQMLSHTVVRARPELLDRVFLDANVLFSAAYSPSSSLKKLWTLARSGRIVLLASDYVVEEARRNLTRGSQRNRLEKLAGQVEIETASGHVDSGKIPDGLSEKDKPVLLAALAMNASHLLTGDITHFGRYYGMRIEGVTILSPGEYLTDK